MGQQTYQRETMVFFFHGVPAKHDTQVPAIIESSPGGWWSSGDQSGQATELKNSASC